MKKIIQLYAIIATMMLLNFQGNAQVDVASHVATGGGNYVGWDNTGTNPPLVVKTTNNDPISFYTNFGTISSIRMAILGGSSSEAKVGIGTTTPSVNPPPDT